MPPLVKLIFEFSLSEVYGDHILLAGQKCKIVITSTGSQVSHTITTIKNN